MKPKPDSIEPGEESVWEYPRPPKLEPVTRHIKIVAGGETIVDTNRSFRVLETSHPPTYYISIDDIKEGVLVPTGRTSICEFKGLSRYWHVMVGELHFEFAAWTYYETTQPFQEIKDHFAFYAHLMDACFVDGNRVQPQSGYFYGGWITPEIKGPFKGPPGSQNW